MPRGKNTVETMANIHKKEDKELAVFMLDMGIELGSRISRAKAIRFCIMYALEGYRKNPNAILDKVSEEKQLGLFERTVDRRYARVQDQL